MKKILIFLLVIMMMASTTFAESKKTIYISNGEWTPYMSEQSTHYGLASHIVSEAFKMENINVKWGFYPWARSLNLAKKAKNWQASCCWWPTNEIEQDFLISEAVCNSSTVFFHLKGYKFDWKKEIKNLWYLKIIIFVLIIFGIKLILINL